MISFVLEETPAYRNWITMRLHVRPRREEPEERYQVVVKFGSYELAIVPALGNDEIRDKKHEQAMIADTIMPYIEKLFEQQ